jgi:CubicO group peptidase (beta-lactamase class C family)
MVLGALLERVTGQTWPQLIHTRLVQHWGLRSVGVFPTPESTPESTQGGLENGQPEALLDFASFGASANVYGSAADLLRFDQILLNHGFLSPESRKTLWESRPEEGFIALGQWAYSVDLCGKSQRIIERRGAIGGVQVRNFLLPDTDTAVVFFAPEASLELGELWQGAGRSYEVLKAAVC